MANTKKATTKKQNTKDEEIIKEETEEMEEILDKKEKRSLGVSIFRRVLDIIFWLAFAILALIWVVDFINVNNEKDPVFCIKNNVYEYSDGQTTECIGLGYKVYNYNRASEKGYEFGPFFIKMKDEN